MPSRPPHPWAPIQPYKDDEPPRIFMSPSESLESIDHDAHHRGNSGNEVTTAGGGSREEAGAARASRAAYARHSHGHGQSQHEHSDQGRMVNPHTPALAQDAHGHTALKAALKSNSATSALYSERPIDPFSDPHDPYAATEHKFVYDNDNANDIDNEREGQGHVYARPGTGPSNVYAMPGNYPNGYDNDNVNLLAWNNPGGVGGGANPYLVQELVSMPYRPMQPRFQKWAKSEIKPEDCVLPLLLITFQTGVVDAATIKDFRTYTTGQTGNSILLALAVFGRRPANLLAGGLSMAGFCLFSVIFGQLGNVYGHKTRGWLLFTMSVQIALLIFNIILVSPALAGVLPEGGPFEWAVIFTSAAQGAGQMVMAINSGCPEINTVGLTGLYAGLGSDPSLFKILSEPHVVKRNRRLWFLVIFWGGTFFGGAIATYSDMWISLIFALECKVVALGMMMLSSAFEVDKGWRERLKKEEELAEAYAD